MGVSVGEPEVRRDAPAGFAKRKHDVQAVLEGRIHRWLALWDRSVNRSIFDAPP